MSYEMNLITSGFLLCHVTEESVEGSWVMRNDSLQTPGGLHTPQLTSTVLRENPRQAAEHIPDQDSSEPGSEPDYMHKYVFF